MNNDKVNANICKLEDKVAFLEETLYKTRAIAENAYDGIVSCYYDTTFTIAKINDGFTSLTGLTRNDINKLYSNKFTKLINSKDLQAFKSAVKLQAESANAVPLEYRICKKDGKNLWVKSISNIHLLDRKSPIVQFALTDISKEKKACTNLEIYEKRCNIVMDYANIIVFDYDIKTKRITTHRSGFSEYALPRVIDGGVEQIIEMGIIRSNSVGKLREIFKRIDDGYPKAIAAINVCNKDGIERTVEVALINIYGENGELSQAVGIKKDITQAHLSQREKEFNNTFAIDKTMTYEANISKNIVTNCDKKWAVETGTVNIKSHSELIDYIAKNLVFPESQEEFKIKSSKDNIIRAYKNNQKIISIEFKRKVNNGEYAWFEKTIHIIKDDFTDDIIIRCYICNINARKAQENRVLSEQKHYEMLIEEADIVYEIDISNNRFIVGHEKWQELFGISTYDTYNEMIINFGKHVVHQDDRQKFYDSFLLKNILLSYKNGETKIVCEYRKLVSGTQFSWVNATMKIFENAETAKIGSFIYVNNINEEKEKEIALVYNAQHDLLTGFYNKITVEEKINKFLSSESLISDKHAFFIVDLDYFKEVNDTFGHVFGDAVLSKISYKINSIFRKDDILGRIGGDEFVILMKNIQSTERAEVKAKELLKSVTETYSINKIKHTISVSIGIDFYTKGKTYQDLYSFSDAALYFSKKHGRNRYTVYQENMAQNTTAIREMPEKGMTEIRKFDENIAGYVFRILYEATDKETAINAVLALVGNYYGASRVYVFEDSQDGKTTSNTFEWCNDGIEPAKDMMKNMKYSALDNYKSNFNDEGIFYMGNIDESSTLLQNVLIPQKPKSMIQYSIVRNGNFIGFIGIDQCETPKTPSARELSDLKAVANNLGVFIMEMRTLKISEKAQAIAMSIVNGLSSYAYVCDKNTYEILFINKKVSNIAPNSKVGNVCYKTFWNKDSPCKDCPMKYLPKDETAQFTMDMHNDYLNVWIRATASWIEWIDGERACLIDSVDITKYINNPH